MVFSVAMVLPLQGPGGIYTPAAEAVTDLAVAKINASGGIAGEQLTTVVIDGGAPPGQVQTEIRQLVDQGHIQAVSGWHISTVRHAIAPVVAGRIPCLYPAVYEGGEKRSGIYCIGEVPSAQLTPALQWLKRHRHVRRWFIVGDDYVWPRRTSMTVAGYASALGLDIVGAIFLRGTHQVPAALDAVAHSSAEGVLMRMVGENAAVFNSRFAARSLHEKVVRLSPLMDENTLLAGGPTTTSDLYSTAGYFRSLATAEAIELQGRYLLHEKGVAPALSGPAESCYESLHTLRLLVERASSAEVKALDAVVDGTTLVSARGSVVFEGNHARQQIYLAQAAGVDFSVVAAL